MTKTAFLFPGQGSQSVGMLSEQVNQHPLLMETLNHASEILGYDVVELIQHGPAETLNQTDKTQPILLATSVGLWRSYEALGLDKPDYLAGHSLGEYSALVCAEVLSFYDALTLVEKRGQFMQEAVSAGEGAMYAIIGLSDEQVIACCAEASSIGVVSAVNFNSPGQVVIAGATKAVEEAGRLCKEAGAKRALPLPVSVPSHCLLMKPAAQKLEKALESIDFSAPKIPVLHNVDASVCEDPQAIKQLLVAQLYSPVLWTQTIQNLLKNDVKRMLECGSGKVLTGLNKRIDKSISSTSICDLDEF